MTVILANPERVESEADEAVSLDSFGLPEYHQRFPRPLYQEISTSKQERSNLSVPWNLRTTYCQKRCKFFDTLRTPQFWKQFEFAARITLIAVLIPAALIAAKLPHSPFVSVTMPMSAVVLGSRVNVGEAFSYLSEWIRGGIMWLPLATIGYSIGLNESRVAWYIYYGLIEALLATLTEDMVRKIVLLLFNSCMIGILLNPNMGKEYPSRVMVDWCIGTILCTVATFFPYPFFCKKEAQNRLAMIAKNTGTAFRGLAFSFWSPSNVERLMAMSKVRNMTSSLDNLFPQFEFHQKFSVFEFMFESTEVRELRALKFRLFEHLRVNLSSITRAMDSLEANPLIIDGSDRAKAFGELLTPHLTSVAEAFDFLVDGLGRAKNVKAVKELSPIFQKVHEEMHKLKSAYDLARRMLFYECRSDTLEEFVPLMSFYLFTIVSFRDTIERFEVELSKFKPSLRETLLIVLKKTTWGPVYDDYLFFKRLFTLRRRREVQRVVEAVKVSGAMILTVGFTFLMNIQNSSFTGPNIIAFVAGSNPVEAMQASVVRLTGCVVGTSLGFFAGTFSHTPVQKVASLCSLMFIGTFLRNDKEYGILAIYAMFVLIPLDSIVVTTVDDTVDRMNQIIFGIFIYLFISLMVYPLSPGSILRRKRANMLHRMSDALYKIAGLLSEPLVGNIPQHSEQAMIAMHTVSEETGILTGCQVSNRSMHIITHADEPMESFKSILDDLTTRLDSSKFFMGFAHEERTLVAVDYPIRTCERVYMHMHRMLILLKTVWCSWNLIRGQPTLSPNMYRMLTHLQPVMFDIASTFSRFTDIMSYLVRDPSVNLDVELIQALVDLISTCQDLHSRKDQMIVAFITESVKQYESLQAYRGDSIDESPEFSSRANHIMEKLKLDKVPHPHVDRVLKRSNPNVSGLDTHTVSPSIKNVPFPETNPLADLNLNFDGEKGIHGPVHLSDSFRLPMSSEDAEGLHSFAICLNLFANETKMFTVNMSTMMDGIRAKM